VYCKTTKNGEETEDKQEKKLGVTEYGYKKGIGRGEFSSNIRAIKSKIAQTL